MGCAFERMAVPAADVAGGSAMADLAGESTTACVVHPGHHGGIAVPVFGGYTLQNCTVVLNVVGWSQSERLGMWTDMQLAGTPGYDGGVYDQNVSG